MDSDKYIVIDESGEIELIKSLETQNDFNLYDYFRQGSCHILKIHNNQVYVPDYDDDRSNWDSASYKLLKLVRLSD